jgi:outer membrane protein TolC
LLSKKKHWIGVLSVCLTFSVYAEEDKPLPDPLSLEQALQMIDEDHPALMKARLDGLYADTDLQSSMANNSVRVDLDGRLRWTDPQREYPINDDPEDHRLRLVVSKPLYDGGFSSANIKAAQLSGASADIDYAYIRDRYSVTVMQQFFDIILADLQTSRETEAMATAFVRLDRAQDNQELGRVSDVDVLELESAYQAVRVKVYNSEGEARKTRQLLALTLNRPGQQPSQITPPQLDVNNRLLPEYDVLLEKVLSGNPRLEAIKNDIESARARVAAAKSNSKPRVTALLERGEQSRDYSSADEWRVGVEMSMPLYDGGLTQAAVRRAQLDVSKLIFQRQEYELELRSQVRELAERFRVLNAERDANLAFTDYRELYMDRSRALYDLEVKTDLGDSMIQISEAHLRDARQQFEMALLIAQLNLLAGEPIIKWDALTTRKTEPGGNG